MADRVDILILGAGPAGAATALALRDSGLKVAIADKAVFPRPKTCGDAIPGPVFKMLRKEFPAFAGEMENFTARQEVKHCDIVVPNGRSITIDWKAEAYNSPRLDFDNFLLSLVRKYTGTTIYEGFEAGDIKYADSGWIIKERNNGATLNARLLIGCDGANSLAAKMAGGKKSGHDRHCTAVSAYYRDIASAGDTNKFFLFKDYLPGYLWVFPVGEGIFNVGFGIMTAEVSKRKLRLREIMEVIIDEEPVLKEIFKNSTKITETRGFGLPLGGGKKAISGEGFMLAGDAASLIDPLQGHGIDKAVFSGIAAARQAAKCFAANNFSGEFISNYDKVIATKYSGEFKRNYRLMQVLHRFPWLADASAYIAGTAVMKKIISKWF